MQARDTAHVNINRFTLPKNSRDLILACVTATSIAVSIVIFLIYLSTARALADAYKDIRTQVWVKQDKDEEKFEKFIAGPYAQQMAEVRMDEMLRQQQISACKERIK